MSHGPRRLLLALVAGVSLTAMTACAGPHQDRTARTAKDLEVSRSPAPAALTSQGARHALLTMAYLGSQWTEVRDVPGAYDDLLQATVDRRQFYLNDAGAGACQQLLDRLSRNRLVAAAPDGSAHAVAVFASDDGARLRYEVGAYPADRLAADRTWLAALPDRCDQFEATRPDGSRESVQVTALDVPKTGGTRQALQVVARGTTNGVPFTLSLDVALVTSESSAISVINGGLGGASAVATEQAVRLGGERLATVLAGGTPPASPDGLFD
ncbi:hypothetical protein [Streptomyces sp. S.PB5]|uniref:hypothetical protein n=1 Tax=Streptomyces sp. S.PB5 TaxID=3020844 RepID=UPI0025B11252|nr:hypothetical protein [Streptomyces sp. S.PB5]MDN3027042.1 hypothetical protein [Streptomyces sp. S.PB5]